MANFKLGRTSEDIKQSLCSIFRELKDPRISKMLSIIKLDLSNDMSHCNVYISAIEGFEKSKESAIGLKNASGFIKKELSSRLDLRKIPELHFIPDNSIEYSTHINETIAELNQNAPKK